MDKLSELKVINETGAIVYEIADDVSRSDISKLKNDLFEQTGGYLKIDNFKYGFVLDNLTPIATDQKQFKYIVVDIEELNKILNIYSNVENYIPMYFISFFDYTGAKLISGSWKVLDDSVVIKPKSMMSNYPTIKYVSLTIRYTTDGTSSTSISEIPLDGIYLKNKDDKTLNERIALLESILADKINA